MKCKDCGYWGGSDSVGNIRKCYNTDIYSKKPPEWTDENDTCNMMRDKKPGEKDDPTTCAESEVNAPARAGRLAMQERRGGKEKPHHRQGLRDHKKHQRPAVEEKESVKNVVTTYKGG